ncbi:hypothetical protein ESCO_001164 [Escovopsis weberi]|uniref:Uncharacterized protein n=1 Tax=Escovopsis weberi TaxID=150374 RepID=A0A0M8MUN7_ESCWE|nr:hypothetical protein ESCO_001164 [Escovopsis weberi]
MPQEHPIVITQSPPLIPSWSLVPIPNLSLSAGGILALADLTSVAERTAIKGGSSWLDAFVLAPGLHYQQAADALDRNSASALSAELGLTEAVEVNAAGDEVRSYVINNVAMVKYLKRLWAKNPQVGVINLVVELVDDDNNDDNDGSAPGSDLGPGKGKNGGRATPSLRERLAGIIFRRRRRRRGQKPRKVPVQIDIDIDTLSHILYLLSPLLTVGAIVFQVLLQEWWGLGFTIALIISRLLNIWVIKERSKPPIADMLPARSLPPTLPSDRLRRRQIYKSQAHGNAQQQQQHRYSEDSLAPLRPAASSAGGGSSGFQPPTLQRESSRLTEYTIDLSLNRRVVLRGLDTDLQAVTTQAWMRAKSTLEGYLEAASKLIVYMIAALSGNLSQAGALVFMVLLLVSAGLLGLSNAHSRSLQIHGRRVGKLRLDRVKFTPYDGASAVEAGQGSPADGFAVSVVQAS